MLDRAKYTTFKRMDLVRLLERTPGLDLLEFLEELDKIECDDAVVIRKRDRFASLALSSYAHAVINVEEVLAEYGHIGPGDDTLTEIADYFAGEADDARKRRGRTPTP